MEWACGRGEAPSGVETRRRDEQDFHEYFYFWFWKGYMSRKMREECVEADLFVVDGW